MKKALLLSSLAVWCFASCSRKEEAPAADTAAEAVVAPAASPASAVTEPPEIEVDEEEPLPPGSGQVGD